jgi:hypothetical protein
VPARAAQVIPPAVVAVAAVAFWRPTLDVFGTVKATVVVLGALALGGAAAVGAARRRTVHLPAGSWPLAVIALLAALVVAVAVSPTPLRSAVGLPGRHGGLIPYAAALGLALAAGISARREPDAARLTLVRALTAAGAAAAGYVLVQAVGLDPFPWTTVEGGEPHFGPFGNVDFASAWLGIVGVLLAGHAAAGAPGTRTAGTRTAGTDGRRPGPRHSGRARLEGGGRTAGTRTAGTRTRARRTDGRTFDPVPDGRRRHPTRSPAPTSHNVTTARAEPHLPRPTGSGVRAADSEPGSMSAGEGRSRPGPAAWRGERSAVAAAALACGAAALATGSLQGPVVLALGLPAVAAAAHRPSRRTAVTLVAVAVVAGAVLALGPARGVVAGAGRSLETRLPKWQAALVMAADAPLLGHGLDTFGDRWFAARPADLAAEQGLARSVDNAHQVPLHLLAGGGVLLAGAWLAAVVVVPGVGLLRRRTWTADPAAVGLVAAWAGYVLQAGVSIDVPPLMVLGLVLSAVVAAEGDVLRVRRIALRPGTAAAVGVAGVAVAVLAAVPVTRAVRADHAGFEADVARSMAALVPAQEATVRAMDLAPWASTYPAAHGAWLTQQGQARAALAWQVEALRREPRSLTHALNVARLLTALGDAEGAALAYDRVLEIDPQTPAVRAEAAGGPAAGPAATSDPPDGPAPSEEPGPPDDPVPAIRAPS